MIKELLNYIFPPRCAGCGTSGSVLCHSCTRYISNLQPRTHDLFFSALPYQDPKVKRVIRALKFKNSKDIASFLGELLYTRFLEELSELVSLNNKIIVIPTPLSKERMRERGFNQSELIARAFTKGSSTLILCTKNVERFIHRDPQSSISMKRMRLKNIEGVYRITHKERIRNQTVIVIDDIATTGATLTELKKVLREAGARKIVLLAVAH